MENGKFFQSDVSFFDSTVSLEIGLKMFRLGDIFNTHSGILSRPCIQLTCRGDTCARKGIPWSPVCGKVTRKRPGV